LERNRISREKRKKRLAAEKQKEDRARLVNPNPRPWRSVEDESGVKLFTIGAVARALGKSVQAVRLWERQGIISAPESKTQKGDRLYTVEEVEGIAAALKRWGKLQPGRVRMHSRLKGQLCRIQLADGSVQDLSLFRVGVLSKAVDKSIVTLEMMETRKILPATPFRSSTKKGSKLPGHRLYTLDQIDAVRQVYEIFGEEVTAEVAPKFLGEVQRRWAEQGVLGAKILVFLDDVVPCHDDSAAHVSE
jgi:DNA-binding transcriptional MerR regulator